jgi:hypothetical protein
MTVSVLSRSPVTTYVSHRLHSDERTWPETNCHADVWIEVLHARGLEPFAGLAFTLGIDYEGDQFTFYKFPHNDLRMLYGIEVQELNLWKSLETHAAQQCALGRVMLVDVDAFYLPDTAGVSYRYEHGKTTIGIAAIDVARREVRYFHGRACYTLGGNDYTGLFRLGEFAADVGVLPPFAEIAKLDGVRRLDTRALVERASALARLHFVGAPSVNPVARFADGLAADLAWLRDDPRASFQQYAFATVRQAGSCFGLTASFLQWLAANGARGVLEAAGAFERLSNSAKTVQFKLARMARLKRDGDIGADVAVMTAAWDEGMSRLSDRFAR